MDITINVTNLGSHGLSANKNNEHLIRKFNTENK